MHVRGYSSNDPGLDFMHLRKPGDCMNKPNKTETKYLGQFWFDLD